ncbi:MAG: alpha/beta hydrolase [Rhodospirillales bacterium CG15_BIG_FIL_POST_REV_8_21_14_020_66_15]|nr:MAG: alpha/beta hydrolase [Rhodospirillales bacterium CG15_BIG_FIL_POST_REV_8_21_14_020_66_15]
MSSGPDVAPDTPPRFLECGDGRTIAYHRLAGKSPGVVFLTGFRSDMTGGKALALEAFCRARGQAFLRFDYTGHGRSSGVFEDGSIGQWAADAVTALDELTEGGQVLVGSSMGGWIMLLAALARKARIRGLVGIAAAPDFTRDLLWDAFTDDQKARMERDGYVDTPNCYDDQEPYRIHRRLIDDGFDHLLLDGPIDLDVPVRLIHGMKDDDVPWRTALRLQERLVSDDVEVQLVKSGGHRLSASPDLERLTRTLDALLDGPR